MKLTEETKACAFPEALAIRSGFERGPRPSMMFRIREEDHVMTCCRFVGGLCEFRVARLVHIMMSRYEFRTDAFAIHGLT